MPAPAFLPDIIDIDRVYARRLTRTPWFFAVRTSQSKDAMRHWLAVPGVGYDGLTREYIMPEEVLSIMLRQFAEEGDTHGSPAK